MQTVAHAQRQFVLRQRTPWASIEQIITTEIEALGATENHEIEHHLGSFCISIDKNTIQ